MKVEPIASVPEVKPRAQAIHLEILTALEKTGAARIVCESRFQVRKTMMSFRSFATWRGIDVTTHSDGLTLYIQKGKPCK